MRAHSYTTPTLMIQMMSDTVTQCANYDGHMGNDQKNASEGLIKQKKQTSLLCFASFSTAFCLNQNINEGVLERD